MTVSIDQAVIGAIGAGAATVSAVREATGLGAGPVREAVQRLRWKGKIKFDRLELSESQRREIDTDSAEREAAEASAEPAEPEGGAGGAEVGPAATPAPPEVSAPVRRGPWREASVPAGELLGEIKTYLERHELSRSRFGYAATGDYGFVQRIEKVGVLQPRTIEKVRAFIAAHPDGLAPKPPRAKRGARKEPAIDRPEPEPASADPPPVSEPVPAQACPDGPEEGAAVCTPAAAPVSLPPVPKHEPEVSRTPRPFERVRSGDPANRALANPHLPPAIGRGRKRIGLPSGLTAVESLQTLMAETPADLIRIVGKKHPVLWQRVIALGRARGERPALALYAAIEAGLLALEEDQKEEREAAE